MPRRLCALVYVVAITLLIYPLVIRGWHIGWLHFLPGVLMPETGGEPKWAVTVSAVIAAGLIGFGVGCWLVLGRTVTVLALILIVFPLASFGWSQGCIYILGPDFLMPDYEHEVEWAVMITAVLVAAAFCFGGFALLKQKPRAA